MSKNATTVSVKAAFAGLLALFVTDLQAEPFSRSAGVDFFREVPSRSLAGLSVRSDGRLMIGPQLKELAGDAPADLLWSMAPGGAANEWYVGSGPLGKIFRANIDFEKGTYTTAPVCMLDDSHVFVLERLSDGSLLAGTSPHGMLVLVRGKEVVAQIDFPADSIFDILLEKTAGSKLGRALVATGNPGRIYRVDLDKFSKAGKDPELNATPEQLSARGITLFGEVRDRNVRRIARLKDGRLVAGSAPRGSVYAFPAEGGAPVFLLENRDSEVTDILARPDGGLYALVVVASSQAEGRINRPRSAEGGEKSGAEKGKAEKPSKNPPGEPDPSDPEKPAAAARQAASSASGPVVTPVEKFSGRTQLVSISAQGHAETLMSRGSLSYYRMTWQGERLILAGGDQGDFAGYDPVLRVAHTFAGSVSAQINDVRPVGGKAGLYLAMRNNAAGFALLDFSGRGPRTAETKRIDLGAPGLVGMLRSNRLRGVLPEAVKIEARVNVGADEVEGWTEWTPFVAEDGKAGNAPAWGPGSAVLRGRYAKLRLKLPEQLPDDFGLDRGAWHFLPQNHRPQLAEFRVLPPNFGVIPAADTPMAAVTTLGQMVNPSSSSGEGGTPGKKRGNFMSSHVVPAPGTQVFTWTVQDNDGDNVGCTLSICREGDDKWIDVALETQEPFAQIELPTLQEGVYFTKLTLKELAPRPAADRLTVTYEADDFIVDRTAPEILSAAARKEGDLLIVEVHGRDARMLLTMVEVTCNNGWKEVVEQPADGIRDGREERFVVEIPLQRAAGATAAEVTLYDACGNATTRRVKW